MSFFTKSRSEKNGYQQVPTSKPTIYGTLNSSVPQNKPTKPFFNKSELGSASEKTGLLKESVKPSKPTTKLY